MVGVRVMVSVRSVGIGEGTKKKGSIFDETMMMVDVDVDDDDDSPTYLSVFIIIIIIIFLVRVTMVVGRY